MSETYPIKITCPSKDTAYILKSYLINKGFEACYYDSVDTVVTIMTNAPKRIVNSACMLITREYERNIYEY